MAPSPSDRLAGMADCKIGPETRARIAQAWPEILAGLAAGELVRDVLARAGISAGEIRAYRMGDAQARSEWDLAREQSADALFDEAMAIARDPFERVPNPENPDKPLITRRDAQYARLHVDTLKWAAAKRNPRLYSDKAQLDVNIKTIDLTRVINDANARLAAARRPQLQDVVDAEIVQRAIAHKLEDLL